MKYLLDASAFILLIKKADIDSTVQCLENSLFLDLTFYEVGNAIWKESSLTKFLTPKSEKFHRCTIYILCTHCLSTSMNYPSFHQQDKDNADMCSNCPTGTSIVTVQLCSEHSWVMSASCTKRNNHWYICTACSISMASPV